MIKKLRKQFIIIAMASMGAVLALVILFINISNYRSMMNTVEQRMDVVIDMVNGDMVPFNKNAPADNSPEEMSQEKSASSNDVSSAEENEVNGKTDSSEEDFSQNRKYLEKPSDGTKALPDHVNQETRFDTRYFVVDYDSEGNYSSSDVSRIASIDTESAKNFSVKARNNKESSGIIDGFYYETISDSDNNVKYVFLDISRELDSFRSYLLISVLTSLVGAMAVFVLILIFSKKVMKPVAESYEKQKRFITDASHEIKTPLAIIGANTEVIELESGENEWTKSINHQIKRLSSLVEKMVFLSKMDEDGAALQMMDFDATEAVTELANSFDPVAESKGFHYEKNIEEGMHYYGDKDRVTQLISLLLDNSMKYCSDDGLIRLTVSKGRKKGLAITVYNTCDSIQKGNNDLLFERFYRADESRNSKTGGHGIGLSVVRAIAEAHHGEAHAFSEDGRSVSFTIRLN